ncbi:MAG: hypothetical protein L0226_15570 [Acidobacteria bacterium]|nr:hypothetical protein [Acidobacteriota bacterium]
MPTTEHVCKNCGRKIDVNYKERGGVAETRCLCGHTIRVNTDSEGNAIGVDEIKPEKPLDFFGNIGRLTFYLLIFLLIWRYLPPDMQEFLRSLLTEILIGVRELLQRFLRLINPR